MPDLIGNDLFTKYFL